MIKKKIIHDYNKNGVVVLRNIIPIKWINILKRGLKKNFQILANTNVFMKRLIKKNFFMTIIVIGIK